MRAVEADGGGVRAPIFGALAPERIRVDLAKKQFAVPEPEELSGPPIAEDLAAFICLIKVPVNA